MNENGMDEDIGVRGANKVVFTRKQIFVAVGWIATMCLCAGYLLGANGF